MHALVAEGAAELLLQDVFDAAHHEVHDGLRGIDDAVGVGFLGGEALEEALVHRVHELLLLGVVLRALGGQFDGAVEVVEALEEFVATGLLGGHRVDDLFDFDGDDVAAGEVGGVEDAAEDALGHQMLDEHGLDGFDREVGIDGLAANVVEGVEALDELGVGAALGFDLVFDALGDGGDALLEGGDGLVPFFVVGLAVAEEDLEQFDEVAAVADVFVQALADAVLEEDGLLGGLKDDVGLGIAAVELGADFAFEVVVLVFGFPEAARKVERVNHSPVNLDDPGLGLVDGVFGNERPFELASATAQQGLKGAAHRHLVVDVELPVLAERLVIALYQL